MGPDTDPEKDTGSMTLPSSSMSEEHESANRAKHRGAFVIEDDVEWDAPVTELARKFTRDSAVQFHQNPFNAEPDSILDPKSENFSPRAWAEALIHLKSRGPDQAPDRTAGVAFRNLSVYGFGNPTDYQKSVGNIWLSVPGLVRRIMRVSSPRRIDILRNFDGLVKSGEMLVVLGPPGSGCSTLLKTIAGETNGLNIASHSELNYQGTTSVESTMTIITK